MSKVWWNHCACYCWPMTVGGSFPCKLCGEMADSPCNCAEHDGKAKAL